MLRAFHLKRGKVAFPSSCGIQTHDWLSYSVYSDADPDQLYFSSLKSDPANRPVDVNPTDFMSKITFPENEGEAILDITTLDGGDVLSVAHRHRRQRVTPCYPSTSMMGPEDTTYGCITGWVGPTGWKEPRSARFIR